jgi:hypothetical protein
MVKDLKWPLKRILHIQYQLNHRLVQSRKQMTTISSDQHVNGGTIQRNLNMSEGKLIKKVGHM